MTEVSLAQHCAGSDLQGNAAPLGAATTRWRSDSPRCSNSTVALAILVELPPGERHSGVHVGGANAEDAGAPSSTADKDVEANGLRAGNLAGHSLATDADEPRALSAQTSTAVRSRSRTGGARVFRISAPNMDATVPLPGRQLDQDCQGYSTIGTSG
ncbi:hypothetical protein ON010_g4448 [Phytophthora cinnamomi]|nr:hypothetical protein ON010_g4448 [Phytophthora cinnamomi]